MFNPVLAGRLLRAAVLFAPGLIGSPSSRRWMQLRSSVQESSGIVAPENLAYALPQVGHHARRLRHASRTPTGRGRS